MSAALFAAASAAYIACLAVVDGAFNRLVFREHAALPYDSPEKRAIYTRPEWRVIGVVYLLLIPVAFPCLAAWAIGGRRFLLVYLAALCFVQWDMIFGRVVFGDWWGDTPSIAFPYIGWVQLPLKPVVAVRVALGTACAAAAWALGGTP